MTKTSLKNSKNVIMGKFLVTLKMLNIYTEKFNIEDLEDKWVATITCLMARNI